MITQEQLQKLTREFKINKTVVAREFVQITFLKELYTQNFSKDLFFKGGTAIRLLYGGHRFSEDLDFTFMLEEKEFEKSMEILFSALSNRYPFKFKERSSITGKTYLLTAQIPVVEPLVYVRLDFSAREDVLEPTNSILKTRYPVIVQNFIRSLSKDEILAEKVRALMTRNKHRDLYDLWILQDLGGVLKPNLIKKKLNYYGEKMDRKKILARLEEFSKEEFVVDLRPFVSLNERDKLGDLFDYVIAYLKESFASLETL